MIFKRSIILLTLILVAHQSFTKILEIPEVIEEEGIESGSYIAPNEKCNYLYRSTLEKSEGIYISVGSFRALYNLVMGNAKMGILLDYDRAMTRFNRANLELIEALGEIGVSSELQRYIYIGMLRLSWRATSDLEALLEGEEEDKIGAMLNAFSIGNPSRIRLKDAVEENYLPEQLLPSVNEFLEVWKGVFANTLVDHIYPTDAYLKTDQERIGMTYWGSDEAWEKIQTMIREERIAVMNGSLIGDDTLQSLGQSLRKFYPQEKVSIVDISNAQEYFLQDNEELGIMPGQPYTKWMRNLRVLPLTPDAKILMTTSQLDGKYGSPSEKWWSYFIADLGFFDDRLGLTFEDFKHLISTETELQLRDGAIGIYHLRAVH